MSLNGLFMRDLSAEDCPFLVRKGPKELFADVAHPKRVGHRSAGIGVTVTYGTLKIRFTLLRDGG